VIGPALDRVFRAASGRIIAALAARFRDLTLAEDAFSESCARALESWPSSEVPADPAAWLYQVALRAGLDMLRRQRVQRDFAARSHDAEAGPSGDHEDAMILPDERLRLIFICCHPAVGIDARAALTLRLVCGLSALEIARAFLVSETTLEQRLVRAKRKIAEAGVPFGTPAPAAWGERLDAVLSTLEVAYSKAHEDASGTGPHSGYALEVLELSRLLAELLPREPEVLALAALIRFAEARRPARVDTDGLMIPLSEQDPARWNQTLIGEAGGYLDRAIALDRQAPKVMQARLQAIWCYRSSLDQRAPWTLILTLYDELLTVRDDAVVRLNRIVALTEAMGVEEALAEFERLDGAMLADFAPFHVVRADLMRRASRFEEARVAYDRAIALTTASVERRWLQRQRSTLNPDAA
jgi:RNA polymerase sigma-70 factor, ECF subfamily